MYTHANTLHMPCPPTIAVDPGWHVGIMLRDDGRAVNYGAVGPVDPDGDTDFNYRTAAAADLDAAVARHLERVLERVDWLADTYHHLAPDGFTYAVEVFSPAKRSKNREAIITFALAVALRRQLRAVAVPPTSHGRLHTEDKGGTGVLTDYYPACLYGRRGRWGEPNELGRPVGLLACEAPGRNRSHEQAAYDIAAHAHQILGASDRVRVPA